MPELKRLDRTVIATGGVSTPSLERLQNGDLLCSYRRIQPLEGRHPGLAGWNGEVIRSRDGGRTWSEPILRIQRKRPDDPPGFLPYIGMIQLPEGAILLPCLGGTNGVYLMRSEDNGESWSGPDPVGQDIDGVDWNRLHPYGKIRLLSDGTLIMPVFGRFHGSRDGFSGQLRSSDGGRTWNEFVTVAKGLVAYNDTIELPDGRMMAIVSNMSGGEGMAPFLWTWSEDLGRTWSKPEIIFEPIYGQSPSMFMTKKGSLICGFRWFGDSDQRYVGVGYSFYTAEVGWNGIWHSTPKIVWLGRGILAARGGTHFAGYPTWAYVDDERILCAYFMSWMGGGDPENTDIEGVYFVETD